MPRSLPTETGLALVNGRIPNPVFEFLAYVEGQDIVRGKLDGGVRNFVCEAVIVTQPAL